MALTDGLPRSELQVGRSRRVTVVAVAVVVLLGLAVLIWYVNSPADLPVSDEQVTASTPVDQPVYIGVFAPADDFDRTLTLSGVKVHATSNTDIDVEPLLCRGGDVGVTATPELFCTDLQNPEGKTFGEGDDIVLRVSGPLAAIAVIDRVRLGFREGIQVGTFEAGSDAVVRILGR